jgi:hypothetical protein
VLTMGLLSGSWVCSGEQNKQRPLPREESNEPKLQYFSPFYSHTMSYYVWDSSYDYELGAYILESQPDYLQVTSLTFAAK